MTFFHFARPGLVSTYETNSAVDRLTCSSLTLSCKWCRRQGFLLCTGSCSTMLHWSILQMIPSGGYSYSTSKKATSFFSGVQNWHLPSQNFFSTPIFPLTSKGARGQEFQFCELLFVCFCSPASHTPLYFHYCKCTLVKCLPKFIFTITQLLIFTWSRAMFDESIGHGNDGMMPQLAFLFSLHVVFCESVQWNHSLVACGWVVPLLFDLSFEHFDVTSMADKRTVDLSIWWQKCSK